MPVVTQTDYVTLTEKEVQEALKRFILKAYQRKVKGEVHLVAVPGKDMIEGYTARADLEHLSR